MILTVAPILAFPNFSCDFYLETDASGLGLGAVLSQEQADGSVRPITFAGCTLKPHERNYAATEMEAFSTVWAVRHFGSTCMATIVMFILITRLKVLGE